jgi:multicomponent Na+:H+ antiporter subunit G
MNGDLRDYITAGLVLIAAIMCLAAGVGVLRLPDVLSRLHAATKPQIFGLMVITIDIAFTSPSPATITLIVAVLIFQGLTAPVSAHMVGRAAYRTEHVRRDVLLRDEFADRVQKADREQGDQA